MSLSPGHLYRWFVTGLALLLPWIVLLALLARRPIRRHPDLSSPLKAERILLPKLVGFDRLWPDLPIHGEIMQEGEQEVLELVPDASLHLGAAALYWLPKPVGELLVGPPPTNAVYLGPVSFARTEQVPLPSRSLVTPGVVAVYQLADGTWPHIAPLPRPAEPQTPEPQNPEPQNSEPQPLEPQNSEPQPLEPRP